MIELSKCPNCSEDERVTIAGKEFCMRCGTPSEDNAMMGVNQAQSEPAQAVDSASTTDQSAVQKFSDVHTTPVHQTENINQVPPVGEFVAPPRMEVAAVNSDPANNSAAPPSIIHTHQAASTDSVSASQPVTPALAPPPTNVMPQVAAMGTMSLDKKQPGVLSDDQFDQLTASVNSAVAPATQAPMFNTQPPPTTPSLVSDMANNSAPGIAENIVPKIDSIPPRSENNSPQQEDPVMNAPKLAMSTDIYSNEDKTPASGASDQAKSSESRKKSATKVAKPVAIAVSIAALFATGAYIWKINYPSLAFKIASAKAGISATMPGYVPAGYNLGGRIQTNPGTVSYSLLGNSNDNRISVTQTKTDWDSQALAENYVAPKAENYLALDGKGQELNQDQIIKIATSL